MFLSHSSLTVHDSWLWLNREQILYKASSSFHSLWHHSSFFFEQQHLASISICYAWLLINSRVCLEDRPNLISSSFLFDVEPLNVYG